MYLYLCVWINLYYNNIIKRENNIFEYYAYVWRWTRHFREKYFINDSHNTKMFSRLWLNTVMFSRLKSLKTLFWFTTNIANISERNLFTINIANISERYLFTTNIANISERYMFTTNISNISERCMFTLQIVLAVEKFVFNN